MKRDFHRRERTSPSLERSHPSRSPRDTTLIICPPGARDYFSALVEHLQLSSQVIVAASSAETHVAQVEEALDISRGNISHRRLFALLERGNPVDDDAELIEQIRQARHIARHHDLPNNRIFRLIMSTPSFPLWLLLHFADVDFADVPETEWAQKVDAMLEEFVPGFKTDQPNADCFAKTSRHLEKAIERGRRLSFLRSVQMTPSTEVHELIGYLVKLGERNARMRD